MEYMYKIKDTGCLLTAEKYLASIFHKIIQYRLKKAVSRDVCFPSLESNYMNKEIMIISILENDYKYFNICFLEEVLSLSLYTAFKGMIPYIDVVNSAGKNIWSCFFRQPFIDELPLNCIYTYDKLRYHPRLSSFEDIYNDKNREMMCVVYNKYAVLNSETMKYINDEYSSIFQGRNNIIGVLCRGTDYLTKPKYHPVQPETEDVIREVDRLMAETGAEYIYLATEALSIDQIFREHYGDEHILINKRTYYDEKYNSGNLYRLSEVHFDRENDDYYKGLEYLSSILLLSRCDYLVGGNCGGTRAALFFNNMKYKYAHIFNLGLY